MPQSLKWEADQRDKTIALYSKLTQEHLGTKLIIWPEAALPALSHEITDVLTAQWKAGQTFGRCWAPD